MPKTGPVKGDAAPAAAFLAIVVLLLDRIEFVAQAAHLLGVAEHDARLREARLHRDARDRDALCLAQRAHELDDEGVQAIRFFTKKSHEFQPEKKEPMLNVLCYFSDSKWTIHLFPRKLHRPSQFFAEGKRQILLSPASVDFGGVFITPRKEDFDKITATDIADIFEQVTIGGQVFGQLKAAIKNEFQQKIQKP